ncbi:MAG: 6-phosphofructokinase [Nitrospira sp.]|nr:6-phosphofructokinase [bacterium]MBL7049291.1 6-phosphofructokinase [Nitrospira sp.]
MKERVAIVVGGGPAPGINGVISAATVEAIRNGMEVIGLLDGFKWLFRGDTTKTMKLTLENAWPVHSTGGSILRISRNFPDNPEESFKAMVKALKALKINHLITIGGDGTAYVAREIDKRTKGVISVVHVPKTIDNDLPLPGGAPTFGFETARHWGTGIVRNIIQDARTTSRWYFVTTMGRHAGHLALSIGKAAGATLTLIPEEFKDKKLKFSKVADVLEGSIIKRMAKGYSYGVAILAEGVAAKIDPEELAKYANLEKDERGDLRLSEIQMGRIMQYYLQDQLKARGINIKAVHKTIGYELRAADPIPFDAEYTRNLGFSAVNQLMKGRGGVMVTYFEGKLKPIPLAKIIDPATKRTRVRYVDIKADPYIVGKHYMVRLDKDDFSSGKITKLAKAGKMSPNEFRKRFSYLV